MFQPIFLLRKHLEAALILTNPSLLNMLLAQVDNGWWEELADSSNDFSLTAAYADNKLSITAKTAQGEKNATIDVSPNAYDNNSVLAIPRGLQFSVGKAASFTNASPANAAQVKSTVTVAGQESVTVPVGTFDIYKVVMGLGGAQKQTAWYEVADPHRLIKYDNGTTQFVQVK